MPRDIQRRDVLIGAGSAGLVAFAGCTGDGDDDGAGDDGTGDDGTGDDGATDDGTDDGSGDGGFEARVGVLMPETGDLGPLGESIRDGALLAADQINEADVDVSVDTQVEDTATDPQAGISGAEALVSAGYEAVVGPAASNVNLQVTREVFIPNAVVGMSPSSTAPEVTDLDDNDYIFRTCPSDALQGPVMADVVTDRLEAETSSTLYLNDAYGQALENSYVDAYQENGGEVTDRVSFEPEQASYTSQWSDALQSDPDAIMIVGFPQSGIQLFRDFYNEFEGDHPDLDIIVPDGLIDDDLPDEVDNDMANLIGTAPATAGPGAEAFTQAYEDAYGGSPQPFNAHAYDAMAVLTMAAVNAGDNSGEAIRDNVREVANPEGTEVTPEDLGDAVQQIADGEDVNYAGASSQIDFDDNGDQVSVSYDIFEVEDRDFVDVDRIDFEA